jgi:hypothetical protein
MNFSLNPPFKVVSEIPGAFTGCPETETMIAG